MIDTSYLNLKSGLRSMSIYKHLTSSKCGGLARGCIEVVVCKWMFICSMFWIRFYKICASLQTQNVRKNQYFSLDVLQMLIKFTNVVRCFAKSRQSLTHCLHFDLFMFHTWLYVCFYIVRFSYFTCSQNSILVLSYMIMLNSRSMFYGLALQSIEWNCTSGKVSFPPIFCQFFFLIRIIRSRKHGRRWARRNVPGRSCKPPRARGLELALGSTLFGLGCCWRASCSPLSPRRQVTEKKEGGSEPDLWPGVGIACLLRQTLESSFLAVSKPNFASKY